jgi:ribosomal protein L29
MKSQSIKQLKEMSAEQRTKILQEQRDILRQLRFQAGSGELKQNHKVKQVKQIISRILTIK